MKKPLSLSILSISLLASSLVPNLAFATSDDEYWTFEEMQRLNTEVQEELKNTCASTDDFMCSDSFFWRKADNDPMYKALMSYRANILTITAFDPERETMRFYYDLQSIPTWENPADPTLADLYVAQFETDHFQSGFYISLEKGKTVPYTNILLNKRKSLDDSDWLPSYTEVEFKTPGLSAAASMDPWVSMFYRTVSNVSYSIQLSVEECLTSPDYHSGMECRAVFTPSRTVYLPFDVETETETEPETETETETESEIKDETGTSIGTEDVISADTDTDTEVDTEPKTEPEAKNDDNSSASEIAEKTEVERAVTPSNIATTATNTTTSVPSTASATVASSASQAGRLVDAYQPALAANTATDTSSPSEAAVDVSQPSQTTTNLPRLGGDCEQGSTFPWWFIALVLAGDAVIMWFFWPKREKTQKSAKKS